MRAGEKFVVTEFLVKELRRQSSHLLPAWNGPSCREGDLSWCHLHRLQNWWQCLGSPPKSLKSLATILESICHLTFNAKDIFPFAAGMLSGQLGHPSGDPVLRAANSLLERTMGRDIQHPLVPHPETPADKDPLLLKEPPSSHSCLGLGTLNPRGLRV